jgi:hypothetical protein
MAAGGAEPHHGMEVGVGRRTDDARSCCCVLSMVLEEQTCHTRASCCSRMALLSGLQQTLGRG